MASTDADTVADPTMDAFRLYVIADATAGVTVTAPAISLPATAYCIADAIDGVIVTAPAMLALRVKSIADATEGVTVTAPAILALRVKSIAEATAGVIVTAPVMENAAAPGFSANKMLTHGSAAAIVSTNPLTAALVAWSK